MNSQGRRAHRQQPVQIERDQLVHWHDQVLSPRDHLLLPLLQQEPVARSEESHGPRRHGPCRKGHSMSIKLADAFASDAHRQFPKLARESPLHQNWTQVNHPQEAQSGLDRLEKLTMSLLCASQS